VACECSAHSPPLFKKRFLSAVRTAGQAPACVRLCGSAISSQEVSMGNNSTQGLAVLVLMVAFLFLSIGMFYGGSLVFVLLALVTIGAAIAMFRKVKPLEE
jgi:hypothetical protein